MRKRFEIEKQVKADLTAGASDRAIFILMLEVLLDIRAIVSFALNKKGDHDAEKV